MPNTYGGLSRIYPNTKGLIKSLYPDKSLDAGINSLIQERDKQADSISKLSDKIEELERSLELTKQIDSFPAELWARIKGRGATGQPLWGIIQDILDNQDKLTTAADKSVELKSQLDRKENELRIKNNSIELLLQRLSLYEDTKSLEDLLK